MTQPKTVAVLVGSLRKDSVSRKVAATLAALTPQLQFRSVEIGDLPHFDQDLEDDPPAPWVRLRQQIAAADAVLFVTPEYNRGVPGVLKNAIDVGSRPYGQSVWNGKPGAVVTLSPGPLGGYGANHHLRQSLNVLNVPVLPNEAYVGNAWSLFDDTGELANDATAEFLKGIGQAFAGWIDRFTDEVPTAKAA
jgi:chromate reductase, NAD(P)H dehydrogenase (quinone)